MAAGRRLDDRASCEQRPNREGGSNRLDSQNRDQVVPASTSRYEDWGRV